MHIIQDYVRIVFIAHGNGSFYPFAAIVGTVAALYSGYGYVFADPANRDHFRDQVGTQVRNDGFTTERGSDGSEDYVTGRIHIGELVMGKCTFKNVEANTKTNRHSLGFNWGDKPTTLNDIVSYDVPSVQNPGILLNVQNATMLKRLLPPSLDCEQ